MSRDSGVGARTGRSMAVTTRNPEDTTTTPRTRIRAAAFVLTAVLFIPCASAFADASPTGRTPKLFWTSARQAIWNRMRSENHPWWKQIKANADLSGTSTARYADLGQWATMAYQVTGDPVYAQKAWAEANSRLKGTTPPDSSRNFTREHFIEYAWMYDWLYPALTDAQRQQWIDSLNYWADLCLGATSVSWGTRLGDSDETTGHFFGIVLWDLASVGDNPRSGTLIPASKVGGLDQTSTSRNNMRNAVADYVKRAAGGVWIESSKYNMGTLQLLLMGADGVKTAVGAEKFPELTSFRKDVALAQMHEVSSNLSKPFQWGDNEEPRSLNRDRRTSLMAMLAGLLTDDASVGPVTRNFLEAIRGTEEPAVRWMIFGNPYAASSDFRTGLATGHYAPGMGVMLARDTWASSGSLFGSHMASRPSVDHGVQYLNNFDLYRAGEYAVTHVIGYDAVEGEHHNAMLLAGLSGMQEARGPIAQEFGSDGSYAYQVGATGGNRYTNGFYNPPPRYVHEWTRSLLYLPSTDQQHDTVVVFDRVNAEDPKALPKLAQYNSTDEPRILKSPNLKRWIIHMPVVPAITPEAITWHTAGGQTVRVNTLLPTDQSRTVYDEAANGLKGTIRSSELKYQVRIAPTADRRWDTFLNVIQASDSTTGLSNILVSSTNNGTKGVLIKRPGHTDVLALFNATQGPDLPSSKVVNGYLETDSTLLSRLNTNRLHANGFTVFWAAGTTTKVHLMDLDPAKQWMVAVDGLPEASLAVSSGSMAIVTVPGSGSHTLQVRPAGAAADTTAPAITNVQVSNVTDTGALVSWTTNEAATEQVEYGTTSAFGQRLPLASSLSTAHQVLLSGLSSQTAYYYRVTSTDAAGNAAVSASATFQTSGVVVPPTANTAPVLTAIGSKSVAEGAGLAISVTGSDADGDPLTYSASGLPVGATFAGQTFQWTPSFDQAGNHMVTFAVSDGQAADSEAVTITVSNTNRPPTLDAVGNKTVAEGQPLIIGFSGTDPDGDPLTYGAAPLPAGAALHGAVFDWTPSFTQAGTYGMTVTVSDGAQTAQETISIVVSDVPQNAAPTVGAGPDLTATLASPVTVALQGVASDDGLPMLSTLISGWSVVSGAGTVVFGDATQAQTTATFTVAGTYQLRLTVSDGLLSASDDMAVVVNPPATDPLMTNPILGSGRSARISRLAIGAILYTDRTYTVTAVPTALAGYEFLRLPNEDKYRKDSVYVTFTLARAATVYVTFDPRADALPTWLKNGWTLTGDILQTSDGPRALYRKAFAAGTVKLGGNGALWKINAYSQYTVIAVPN